jgi:hypothetical protein
MELAQYHETVMATRGREHGPDTEFRYLCLPRRADHRENQHLLEDPASLLAAVDLAEPVSCACHSSAVSCPGRLDSPPRFPVRA